MAVIKSLSNFNGSARGAAALADILTYSPLMNALDVFSGYEDGDTSFRWRPTVAGSSAAARAIGSAYSPTAITPETEQTDSLANHGAGVKIDVSHLADVRRSGGNLSQWLAGQLKKELKNFAIAYELQLVQGTGQANAIEGLQTILDGTDLPGYPGITRVTNAATASVDNTPKSLDLTLGATNLTKNTDGLLELLYNAFADTDQTRFLYMNSGMFARMQTIARTEHILGENRDLFGIPVPTFNGVPMITCSTGAITSTEDDDTATPLAATTSIYLMSPGEMRLSLVTNSGLEYWEYPFLEAAEAGEEKWEIRAQWKIEEPTAITRIRNIKI